jgi:hypothetical protein
VARNEGPKEGGGVLWGSLEMHCDSIKQEESAVPIFSCHTNDCVMHAARLAHARQRGGGILVGGRGSQRIEF